MPKLREDIRTEWAQCEEYACCRKSRTQSPPLFPMDLMAFNFRELWILDLFKFQKKHFLSQYIMLKQVQNQKTKTKTKKIVEWTLMFRLPSVMKSDGRPCFMSRLFKHFGGRYNIEHVVTSAYHTPSSGQAVRALWEVKKMLEKYQNFCPMQVAFTLNSTEWRPNLGAPINIFMGRATRGLEPNTE